MPMTPTPVTKMSPANPAPRDSGVLRHIMLTKEKKTMDNLTYHSAHYAGITEKWTDSAFLAFLEQP